jgi:arabinofuranan 3-O-arabinosyltransferase
VQPLDADRVITKARVRLDGGAPIDVALGDASRTEAGQRVTFRARRLRRIDVEPLEVSGGPSASVGFAEVRVDGVGHGTPLVDEVVRVPTRLLRRAGPVAARRNLGFVFTRARTDPAQHGRTDEELALVRRFELPSSAGTERAFTLSGVARLDSNAPDATLDIAAGTTTPGVEFRASGHRAGDARARASRAFDGSAATAWDAPFGEQVGQWVEADLAQPTSVEGATIAVVADGRHSVPTRVRVEADGVPVTSVELPEVADGANEGATRQVPFRFGPVTASRLRFVVESARAVATRDDRTLAPRAAPVGIAELDVIGVPRAPVAGIAPTTCRGDLLRIDDSPIAVKRVGETIEACDGPLALAAGSHVLRSGVGLDTGIDIDRVVLTSGADGAAAPPDAFRSSSGRAGARVRVVESGATTYDLEVRSAGKPFWLVLGQSHSEGWHAEVSGSKGADGSLGAPRLVNGYANGWLVDPGGSGTFTIHLKWTPQNLVWAAFAASVLAILVCLGVVFATRRRASPDVAAMPELASPMRYAGELPSWRASFLAAAAAGIGAWFVSRAWIGLVVAVGTLAASRVRNARLLLAGGAPAALLLAKAADAPELGWLAITLLAADLLLGWVAHRHREGPEAQVSDEAP